MFIAKWNKSVVLTYIGVLVACFGVYLALAGVPNCACICLVLAGVCDMFDGTIARSIKRNEEEKQFGIELDSLADTVDFIALPIVIILTQSQSSLALLACFALAICGIARLAHFNSIAKQSKKRISHYQGLPVTFSALVFSEVFVITKLFFSENLGTILPFAALTVAALNILNIKIPKPHGLAYGVFGGIAVATIIILGIL